MVLNGEKQGVDTRQEGQQEQGNLAQLLAFLTVPFGGCIDLYSCGEQPVQAPPEIRFSGVNSGAELI